MFFIRAGGICRHAAYIVLIETHLTMKDENNITYRHRMPAQLRFSDVDTFGHVNNSVYFSLFDMGKTQYFIDVVGEHVFDDISIVVAHITADFLAPVFRH